MVGAAIGTGLVARAAERGGADFLLALNAGRLRAQGLPSAASMLPVGDANADTAALAAHEIAPQVSVPVHDGLSVFGGPARPTSRLAELAETRLAGVVNFPGVVHYPPDVRRALDDAGAGFDAELEMLADARAAGFRILAYVKSGSGSGAEAAGRLAPEMICINFGWNAGGRLTDLVPDVSIDEAILRARHIARRLTRAAPGTHVLIEGGPVIHPRQVAEICAEAGTHGYVGGSTLDRLPIEESVYDRALAFKAAALARQAGLVGPSLALEETIGRLSALAEGPGPVLISGVPGTQRRGAAQLLDRLLGARGAPAQLFTEEQPEIETGILLFGRGADRPGLIERADQAILRIEPLAGLTHRWQRKLARFLDRGQVTRYRGQTTRRAADRHPFGHGAVGSG